MAINLGRLLGVTSAIIGAAGTIFLFAGSYAIQGSPFSIFYSEGAKRIQDEISRRNRVRIINQRIGLALILTSFVLQGVDAVVL